MPNKPKVVCHDCDTIQNKRTNRNKVRTACYNCGSKRITGLTDKKPPSTIPEAPPLTGFTMPRLPTSSGGAITPQMLIRARQNLRPVTRPRVALPGGRNSAIARGVRVVAHLASNPRVGDVQLEFRWAFRRNEARKYIYTPLRNHSIQRELGLIAQGLVNPNHGNFNTEYYNMGSELPLRRGNFTRNLGSLTYFEYGWMTKLRSTAKWYLDGNRVGSSDEQAINRFIQQKLGGKLNCERIIIAESGELFYTPNHYYSFKRYLPKVYEWFWYESAGGSSGPQWDESIYDEPYGS